MTTNANYLATLNRGNAGYYTATDANAFNERAVSGSFAAFAAFILRGDYQQFIPPFTLVTPQFIWGNADTNVGSGWSITIDQDSQGVATLFATVYDALGIPNATGLPLGNMFEKIVLFGLWSDGANVITSVNGSIISVVALGSPGYTPSALPARLLADPDTAAISSIYVDVLSAGYSPLELDGASGLQAGVVGGLAGSHFDAFCEGFEDSFLDQNAGLDWLHRYTADSAAAGLRATTVKTAAGVVLTAPALAPVMLLDVGNSGPVSSGSGAAVPLARSGGPAVLGRKNMTFFVPSSLTAGIVPPPQAPVVNLYVSSVLGDDTNPGTQALPLATLSAVDARIPLDLTAKYFVHLRNETYPLPSRNAWLRSRRIAAVGAKIEVFADEAWDATVYTIHLAAAAAAGTNATTVVTAGLVVNAQRGRSIRMTSGAANGQYCRINGNTVTDLSVDFSFSPAPAAADTFEIFSPEPIINVPAPTAPTTYYLLADQWLGGVTSNIGSIFTGPQITTDEGLHLQGLIIAGSTVCWCGDVPLFLRGVTLSKQLRKFGGITLSGLNPNYPLLEGWGYRAISGGNLQLYGLASFSGYSHEDTSSLLLGITAAAILAGGYWSRVFFTIAGSCVVNSPTATPFQIDPGGASGAVELPYPTGLLQLTSCNVQGGGGGISLENGARLLLGSGCTGGTTAGVAMSIGPGCEVVCAGAPTFGGAGNDWLVVGAAAFNKAALAAIGAAVIGPSGNYATRST